MYKTSIDLYYKKASGKGVARKLRAEGMLPGVMYGNHTETLPFYVDARSFLRALLNAKGERILFEINFHRDNEITKHMALIKEIQKHPVNESIRHVDLYEVFLDKEVKVEVPIHYTGKARGVEIEKGVLEIIKRSIKVFCLPDSIPKFIEVDITNLSAGSALHASDIKLPEGVRLGDDPKATLVTIIAPEEETTQQENK